MMATRNVEAREALVRTGDVELEGALRIPEGAQGVVAFVHGSGSSRFSKRNRYVAEAMNDAGFATLLFDLLTTQEGEIDDRTRELRFDIPLLADRTAGAVDWLAEQEQLRGMKIGLFGASTGAAAALVAAAERPEKVGAVVSRGGRPDLASEALGDARAPTLLIVGGDDKPVIGMNETAAQRMTCPHRLEIIPGATHLFEEPGKLDAVAGLARDWFVEKLTDGSSRS